jgi:hypothetical protein
MHAEQQLGIAMIILSNDGERGQLRRDLLRTTWLDAWLAGCGTGMASGPRSALFAFAGGSTEMYISLPISPGQTSATTSAGGGAAGTDVASGEMGELRLACPNGYRFLFLKTMHALRWVVQRRPDHLGPRPRLIFKADEDTYVCSATLTSHLAALPRSRYAYIGQFAEHTKLRIRPGERWEDLPHYHLFKRTFYPPYAQVRRHKCVGWEYKQAGVWEPIVVRVRSP